MRKTSLHAVAPFYFLLASTWIPLDSLSGIQPGKVWDSSLYRLVYHYREQFDSKYTDLFEQQYGFLKTEVLDALDRYLNCGILRHGATRAKCQKCSHSILVPFSCKRRGVCPSCQAKRAVMFAENLQQIISINFSNFI